MEQPIETLKLLIISILSIFFLPTLLYATDYAEGQVIVKYKDGVAATRSLGLYSRGVLAAETMPEYITKDTFLLQTTDNVSNSIKVLEADPNVEYVEPNYRVTPHFIPNDPSISFIPTQSKPSQAWHYDQNNGINAFRGWDIGRSAKDIKVAVIDTGIFINHPDLKANIAGFKSFCALEVDGGNTSHGTHVAGLVGAVGNNGIGAVGVSHNVKIYALKALSGSDIDQEGSECSRTTAIVKAIDYAISLKVDIINASYGTTQHSNTEKSAMSRAHAAGIVFVTSAGNDGVNVDEPYIEAYPVEYNFNNIIAVGASNELSLRGIFDKKSSNYGKTKVHIFTPGTWIWSLWRDRTDPYAYSQGTSMSAPIVTGAVALVKQINPKLTPIEIRDMIIQTARKSNELRDISVAGGVLDLEALLKYAKSTLPPIVDPDDNSSIGGGDTEEPEIPVIKGMLELSTSVLKFDDTPIKKTSKVKLITVKNIGSNSITFNFKSPEAPFILENSSTCKDGATLNAGDTCHIDIKFKPTEIKEYSVTTVAESSSNDTIDIELFGNGIKAQPAQVGGCSVGYGADYFMIIILLSLLLRRRFLVKK